MAGLLPGVNSIFDDNASGVNAGSTDAVHLLIGVAAGGTVNVVNSLAQPKAVRALHLEGQLTEYACYRLATGACRSVLTMRINASVAGTVGSVTSAGTSPPVLTVSSSTPNATYSVVVQIVKAGALNAGQFKISYDGGDTYGNPITLQASYTDSARGIVLGFAAGTYSTNNVYTFSTVGPSYTTTDLTNALAAAKADGRKFSVVHVIGASSSAANDATKAIALNGVLAGWEADGVFVAGLIDCFGDTSADDAAMISAFASVVAPTVAAATGYVEMLEEDGELTKTPAGCVVGAQAARVVNTKNGIATLPMQVEGGALPNVKSIGRDERLTPGLDAARFTTLRTYNEAAGYYITNMFTLALPSSDVSEWANRLVVNKTRTAATQILAPFIGKPVKLNADGTLQESEAKRIGTRVEKSLKAVLVQSGNATDVTVVVDQTNNVRLTKNLIVTVRVQPYGYAKFIDVTVGFAPLA